MYIVYNGVLFILGLGILNVWLLRPQKATAYRGGMRRI